MARPGTFNWIECDARNRVGHGAADPLDDGLVRIGERDARVWDLRRHPFQLPNKCQTAQKPSELDMVLDLFDTSLEIPRGRAMQICHFILMKNDRSLGFYARRKYECHHGCPRFSERSVGSSGRVRACQPTTEKTSVELVSPARTRDKPVARVSKRQKKMNARRRDVKRRGSRPQMRKEFTIDPCCDRVSSRGGR
jgi:hypothetical protein